MTVLCILLSAVCLADYRRARIPNGMVFIIFLYGLGYRYWDAGGPGWTDYLVTCLIIFIVLYPFFKIGAVGAGDVKLFSVTAGYLSGRAAACFLVISLLIAALISLIKICREHNGRERMLYLCSYLAGVWRSGQWTLYLENLSEARKAGIHMAGPILLSVLLHTGGVY